MFKSFVTSLALVVGAALASTSSSAFAADMFPKDTTIVIVGEIGRGTIDIPQRVLSASKGGKESVYLFLNSPGGSVVLGNMIVQAIETVKARGSKVICGTGALSASMGFSILTACSVRYVLPTTRLLFHPPRVGMGMGGVMTPTDAAYLSDDLGRTDAEIRTFLTANMPIKNKEWFDFHYRKETLWTASSLNSDIGNGFLTIVNDMSGIPDDVLLTFLNKNEMQMGEASEYILTRLAGEGN